MPDDNWTLDQDSELNVLIPWLDAHPESDLALRRCLAAILRAPFDRGAIQEYADPQPADPPMLWAEVGGGTDLGVIYLLNPRDRTVVLADIGRA
jgi:hypothetical protein